MPQAAEDFLDSFTTPVALQTPGAAGGPAEDFLSHPDFAPPAGPQEAPPPKQMTGLLREPALAAKALGSGVAGIVELPGDAASSVLGSPPVSNQAVQGGELGGRFPTSADLAPITNALGITGTPQLTPQGPAERYGAAALSALPAAAASVATGGAPLPSLLAAETGAESGEAAHELFPESRWAPPIAALLAGIGFGGVAGWVQRSAEAKAAAKSLLDADAQLKQASDAKFYQDESAQVAAQAAQRASAAKLAATKDLVGQIVHQGEKEAQGHFEATAASLGDSSTLQQAGSVLQSHARDWIETQLPARVEAAWAPVDQAVPPQMRLPIDQYRGALGQITSKAGELESSAALLKPRTPAALNKALQGPEDLEELAAEPGEEAPPQEFTWKDVRQLRTNLGDAMHNPEMIKNVGAQNLSQLYAALTTDLRVAADRAGVVPQFDEANDATTKLYSIAEGPMSRLVSAGNAAKEGIKPEDAASSLLSSAKRGASDLAVLRTEIPEGVNELAAAHLRAEGPTGWIKLSPEAKSALVGPQGSAALESTIAKQSQIVADSQEKLSMAQQEHADTLSATRQDLRTGNFSRREAVRRATEARDAALAAQPPKQPPYATALKTASALAGGSATAALSEPIAHELGLDKNKYVKTGLALAGAAAPLLAEHISGFPGSLRAPLTSVVAADNPLLLPQETSRGR